MPDYEKQRSRDRLLFTVAVVIMLAAALAWLKPEGVMDSVFGSAAADQSDAGG